MESRSTNNKVKSLQKLRYDFDQNKATLNRGLRGKPPIPCLDHC
jgi:hypothetical protein